jgi:membrane-bound serine protease (ClpP class)
MLLILVEIVFIPGFGFVGLLGGFLLLWGMLQAMISRNPGNPGDLPGLSNFSNLGPAVTTLGLACIGAGVLLALFLRSLGDNDLFGKKLVLANSLESSAATNASLRSLVGETGQALTPLSPSGTVLLHGNEMDALSDGDYVDAGSAVQVTDISGARLVVSKTT